MRRVCLGALTVAAAAFTPAAASAQTQVLFAGGAGTPISQVMIPVRMSGRIIVQFHGDAAAGCAIHGLCGYGGTVSWSAPQRAALEVVRSRVGGHSRYDFVVFPQPSGFDGAIGGITNAEVARTPMSGQSIGTTCTDAISTQQAFELAARDGRVRFSLAQASPSLFGTRCAGPRDDAIIPALPAPQMSVARILRGRLAIGLAASHSFSVDGFSGTVLSNLTLRLGRPGRTTGTGSTLGTGKPQRALRVRLRASLAGSVVEHAAADPSPGACTPLGACGAIDTLTIRPRATPTTAQIDAVMRPGQAAPSLNGIARAAGRMSLVGTAFWPSGGTLDAAFGQGPAQCTDSTSWTGGLVTLVATHHRLIAGYSAVGASSLTECPGPAGNTEGNPLAEGSVPLSRLTRRRITIRLTTGGDVQDYGYGIRTTANLTLTLTRLSWKAITRPMIAVDSMQLRAASRRNGPST